MPESERITLEKHLIAIIEANDKRYEQRFLAQEATVHAAFKAADNALAKVDAATVRDKAAANEWRDAMNDREKNFVGRLEFAAELQVVRGKIDVLVGSQRGGLNSAWGYLIGAVGMVAAVVSLFLRY